jgi:hypothetical protein
MRIKELTNDIRRDPDLEESLRQADDITILRDTCTCPECSFQITDEEILDYADRAKSLAEFDSMTGKAVKAQCYCNQPG